ncbi:MAG: DUF7405 family protein, partial [Chloroflexota bacterium]
AWNDYLSQDEAGNPVMPRFHRLLMFEVEENPGQDAVLRLEASLRTLERRFRRGPDGLMFVLGWAPGYFERWLERDSPVERPQALSSFETPEFDDFDACLHLASDDEERLASVERALVDGAELSGAEGFLDIRGTLLLRETRTGFVGEGLPAARQEVSGVPADRPVPQDSPLFMGFKSGFRKNQATEDDVTIEDQPFVGGSTMQVSKLRLRLESWYNLFDESQRAARMFAPQVAPDEAAGFANEADTFSDSIEETAIERGVVGHLQATGGARRNDRPIILRRDFNTTDGGEAGLHFVALQRSISDFVETRRAMNASGMSFQNPAITQRVNNGIKEFIFVERRANYLVPPRSQRAFPLLPGREEVFA